LIAAAAAHAHPTKPTRAGSSLAISAGPMTTASEEDDNGVAPVFNKALGSVKAKSRNRASWSPFQQQESK